MAIVKTINSDRFKCYGSKDVVHFRRFRLCENSKAAVFYTQVFFCTSVTVSQFDIYASLEAPREFLNSHPPEKKRAEPGGSFAGKEKNRAFSSTTVWPVPTWLNNSHRLSLVGSIIQTLSCCFLMLWLIHSSKSGEDYDNSEMTLADLANHLPRLSLQSIGHLCINSSDNFAILRMLISRHQKLTLTHP